MEQNRDLTRERRRCLRQVMHAPAYASFDGVSGGMILDLSEAGLAMQTGSYFAGRSADKDRRLRIDLDLSQPTAQLETTGYIAWADALGRAGVRFAELPEEARQRLNDWLTLNASAPSCIAPKLSVDKSVAADIVSRSSGNGQHNKMAISLEAETVKPENGNGHTPSATIQYEFSSLGTDLTAALRLIGERARSLTRGSSAAIALVHKGAVLCRASIGESAPALGTRLDVNSGISGECFRAGKTLRCDDTENDPRVDLESCRRLGVRSILTAPVRYERDTVGLLMVCAPAPFNFDEGDVAVAESLAHTVVRSMRQAEGVGR